MLETGKLFVGLNYWASESATRMWRNWNPACIEKDFAVFEEYGVQVLRVFPLWSDFQPIRLLQYGSSERGVIDREVCLGDDEIPLPETAAGRAGMDELMLARFRELCDIAERHGIRLIVAVMTIHMTGRHFVPPAMEGRDVFADPFALKWEMKAYDCFVRTMKDHPAILAWETGNEMNYTGVVKSADHAWVWTKTMHDIIRLADPDRPIIGVMAEGLDPMKAKWLVADQGELADYAGVHRYDITNDAAADGFLNVRNILRAPAECRIIADIGGKPCIVEETGNWRNIALTLEGVGHTVNALLWNAWAEDTRAFLWWCAFDQAHLKFAPYHWGDWPGLEHGVFTHDHAAHPAAQAIRRFTAMQKALPFKALPPVPPDALCLVDNMETALAAHLLARQAGCTLRFQSARSRLAKADVYLLPSVDCRGGISSEDWESLQARIADGAVCFISADDCNLPNLREVCGMEIERRRTASAPLTCVLDGETLSLKVPLEKKIRLCGAETLLADADGNPILLKNTYGKGVVYTLTFALETALARTPRAYESCWSKIYGRILGRKRLLHIPDTAVSVTEHPFENGDVAVVAVNCSDREIACVPELAEGWRIRDMRGDAALENGTCRMPPGGGALFFLAK